MEQPEEFEHVPWSELAAGMDHRRTRLPYIAAAVILAIAVGAVVARSVWQPGSATSTETVPVAAAATPPAAPSTSAAPGAATTLPAPALFSEADLLAVGPGDGPRAAAARAEWFVIDYFTADLDPLGSIDLRRSLPAGAELPDLPQDPPNEGISYVEWARALSVEEVGSGLYRVEVAFRTIAGPPDGPLLRLPVRAVRVAIEGDLFGMAVVDLPAPAPLPVELGSVPWPAATAEPPPAIATAALDAATEWGADAELSTAGPAGDGWRVVVEVADEAGNRWPLALWLNDLGETATPPWLDYGS